MIHRYFIGLGSNLHQPSIQIALAIDAIRKLSGRVTGISTVHHTKAWGMEHQPNFANAVLEFKSEMEPLALLHKLQNIETAMGRERSVKWGPRIIDLDILLCDELNLNTVELNIPHPYMKERDFVMKPLAEIWTN